MPFGTYEKNINLAYKNAEKIINETGADAVKMEGGQKIANTVEFLVKKGITVFGHIGMLPQTFNGKYKVYGKSDSQKKQIIKDLEFLEDSGVFSIVIECTIEKLAKKVCDISNVPIIGIGASKSCDGQILVTEDLLGLTDFNSKFLKKYVNLQHIIDRSLNNFSKDVRSKSFPSRKNFYK
jgi:3-methyl-2-oxobutanoate hydroxymethyltransferase